ncbi:MAG: hypothetical protein ACTSXZ_07790 [Alphaproteobacteria bacterium]
MKGFAMKNARRHGAKTEFQSHGSLRISLCLGAFVAVERIETAPERRLIRFRAGKA